MTPETLQGLEVAIREAITKAQAEGIAIKPGSFGVTHFDPLGAFTPKWHAPKRHCCPIGACLLNKPSSYISGFKVKVDACVDDAAKILGLDFHQVWQFVAGFDDNPAYSSGTSAFYALGQKFRKELVTLP